MLESSNLTPTLLHLLNRAMLMCVFIPLWLNIMFTSLCLCMYESVSGSLWLGYDPRCFSYLLNFFFLFSLAGFSGTHADALMCISSMRAFLNCAYNIYIFFLFFLFFLLLTQMLVASSKQEHWSNTTSCLNQFQGPVKTQNP